MPRATGFAGCAAGLTGDALCARSALVDGARGGAGAAAGAAGVTRAGSGAACDGLGVARGGVDRDVRGGVNRARSFAHSGQAAVPMGLHRSHCPQTIPISCCSFCNRASRFERATVLDARHERGQAIAAPHAHARRVRASDRRGEPFERASIRAVVYITRPGQTTGQRTGERRRLLFQPSLPRTRKKIRPLQDERGTIPKSRESSW